MAVDPAIEAVFGPPPSHIDINDDSVATDNAAIIAMICLATCAVMLRFVGRFMLRNPILLDDYFIILALLCIGATGGISIAGGKYGGSSHHVWSISLSRLEMTYYLLYIYPFIYAAACTSTRISILFFYRRVFAPFDSWIKWGVMFGWFQTLTYPIYLWACMGCLCQPRNYFWLQFGGTVTGKCINVASFFIGAGILNMLNDFILLLIPFPRIWKLQMRRDKKIAICAILAVGFFACVASIVRIWVLVQYTRSTDVTWAMGTLFIWSTIEPAVAIVTACLPHLAPMFKMATAKVKSSSGTEGAGSSGKPQRLTSLSRDRQDGRKRDRGPCFDFGTTTMGNDDEIGLTNYVEAPPNAENNSSIASESEEPHQNRSITIKSSFVQTTAPRSPDSWS